MQFTTPVSVRSSNAAIDYRSSVLSLGSCFAVNIAEKLSYHKLRSSVNPFGILFHPLAIEQVLYRAINQIKYTEADLFVKDGLWRCYEVHSVMNDPQQAAMLERLNANLAGLAADIKKASHTIITYGTSWVYRELQSRNIVANCHKVASAAFTKEILSVETVEAAISNTVAMLRSANPTVQILFTVSPVRHVKDGMAENQRSKANLIAGLHQALDDCGSEATSYFPSYEILMDELRDYRFYASDMLHPSQVAIDYIWQRFVDSHISASAIPTMERVVSVQKALSHRPFNANTHEYQAHVKRLAEMIKQLQNEVPHISFE